MGLERITAVIQGTISNYDTDLFQPLLAAIGELTGHRYGVAAHTDTSMRVVADHMRAMTFLIGDGVAPSNEWRGYVLRKIMRRAMRHGKKLGAREPFLARLVDVLADTMGDQYPEVRQGREAIARVVQAEEERFDAVLTAGLAKLEEVLDRSAAGSRVVPGEDMFRLYDSLGVPIDFIEDLAGERGLAVDRAGFERAMEAQRERARAASAFETLKVQDFVYARLSDAPEVGLLELGDRFEGYAVTRVADVAIAALFDAERVQVDHLAEGQTGYVVLPHTPFYIESGGQVSDTGTIFSEVTGASALVVAMTRLAHGGPRAHKVTLTRGELRQGERVTALVDEARRDATRRNHTATHLLHAALRRVLGPHVKQAGSLVAPDRLRFDFVHFSPISRDEIARIEDLVNAEVHRNTPVVTEVKATEQAIADGATALFGEKYGEHVRVVSVPGVSMELCGGTHCRATGDIGLFTVVAEGGVAAGVRRIEAFTGAGAVAHVRERSAVLDDVLSVLNVPAPQAASSVERLQHELKRLSREVSELKVRAAMGGGRQQDDVVEIAEGVKFVARRVPGMDKAALRTLSDQLRDQIKQGVVVLASEHDDKVSIVVAVTRDLTGRVKAGQVVKEVAPIVGGSGGGRPDFAEAGGRDASGIDALLAKSRVVVERLAGGAA
jgi:alanyl-tRNA synthetase